MQTVTYSEALRNLGAVMDKAAESRAPVLVRRRKGGDVVLVAEAEWARVLAAIGCK